MPWLMSESAHADPPARQPSGYSYPLLLDLRGRRIVIVGGGSVALRKATGLVDAGASPGQIRVVAPRLPAAFPSGVTILPEAYRPAHLDDADLAFAATDSPVVNEQVVRDARARRVLVCRADVDEAKETVPVSPSTSSTAARVDMPG